MAEVFEVTQSSEVFEVTYASEVFGAIEVTKPSERTEASSKITEISKELDYEVTKTSVFAKASEVT